jgi:hypothetical protein
MFLFPQPLPSREVRMSPARLYLRPLAHDGGPAGGELGRGSCVAPLASRGGDSMGFSSTE